MEDPRSVDSEGEIFFNLDSQDPRLEHDDTFQHEIEDREDRASNDGEAAPRPSPEYSQILADITYVLRDMTKEMKSMKESIENRGSRQWRLDCNQNSTDHTSSDRPQAAGLSPNSCRLDSQSRSQYRSPHQVGAVNGCPDHIRNSYIHQDRNTNHVDPVNRSRSYDLRNRQSNDWFNIKIPPFTGKEEWSVWIARFETLAQRYGWTDEDKLDQLLPRIEGQAGEFVFSQLPPRVLNCYEDLVSELNSRFRVIETARSYAVKFSRRSQRSNETVEEYAADLKSLYDKAHGYRDRSTREEDLVRRFFDGLRDEDLSFEVEYHKEPRTLDEAVYHTVNLIQTRNTREKRSRNNMRRATDLVDLDKEADALSRVDFGNFPKKGIQGTENKAQIADKEAAAAINSQNELILQLLERVKKLEDERNPAGIDEKHSFKQRRRNIECFNCHQLGHIARDCPRRSLAAKGQKSQGRQEEPHETRKSKALNFQEPALAAKGRLN